MSDLAKKAPNCHEDKDWKKTTLEFESDRDLFLALHRVDVYYKVSKRDDNNYVVTLKFKDRYNFETHVYGYYSAFKVTIANNTAVLSQYVDVIHPYDWETTEFVEKKGEGCCASTKK